MARYLEAADVRRRLAERPGGNAEFQRTLANTYMNIGLLEKETDPAQARQSLEKAQAIRQDLVDRGSRDPKLQRDLAMGYYNLANLAMACQDHGTAEAWLQQAGELFAEVCQRDPDDLAAAYQLAVCYRIQADLQAAQNRPAEALQGYVRARDVMAPLAEKNPGVAEYQLGLAELYLNTAQAEYEQEHPAPAMASFEKAAALLMPLMNDCEQDPRYGHDLLVTLQGLAAGHEDEARRTQSLRSLEAWEQRLRELADRHPDASAVREQLEETRAVIAELRPDKP